MLSTRLYTGRVLNARNNKPIAILSILKESCSKNYRPSARKSLVSLASERFNISFTESVKNTTFLVLV